MVRGEKLEKKKNIYHYNLVGETQLVLQDQQNYVG